MRRLIDLAILWTINVVAAAIVLAAAVLLVARELGPLVPGAGP